MAMIPMKTITAEKAMLLIVAGSQVFEVLLVEGMFGKFAGSLGSPMLPDQEMARL